MLKLPRPHQPIRIIPALKLVVSALFVALVVFVARFSPFTIQDLLAAQPFRVYDNNVYLCVSDPCTATAPSSEGNFIIEGLFKMVGGSPASGKVLMSDANGVAFWEFLTNGWTDGGDTIYTTTATDNVAIGTTTPAVAPGGATAKLTIDAGNAQYPVGLYIYPSTHASSERAGINLDGQQIATDYGGAGNHSLFIWDRTNSKSPLRINETGVTWDSASNNIELFSLGTGARQAQIDFHGDDTYTDYGLQLLRGDANSPNAVSRVFHRGTGQLILNAQEATPIGFYTQSLGRLILNSAGTAIFNVPESGYTIDSGSAAAARFYRAAADIDTNNGGQLEIMANVAGNDPTIGFLKSTQWGGHFGLDDDNWFSTRGYSAGSTGYTSMKVGNRLNMQATSTNLRWNDTDNNPDWHAFLGITNLVFVYDAAGDGEWEDPPSGTYPMILNTTTVESNDWECPACIDQGDLKTSTGLTAGFVAVDIRMSDYSFMPNIEYDNCATVGGGVALRPAVSNWANDTVGTFRMDQSCSNTATSWKVRYRFVAASRDPEIFAWYDPKNGVIQHIWVSEVPLTGRHELPVTLLEEHPDWIPVQATIFDRDIAKFNQEVDIDDLLNNFTFKRIAKASSLEKNDDLVRIQQHQYETCIIEARKLNEAAVDPESKCPQFITHPDIYYGELVRSDKTAAIKQQMAEENAKVAKTNKFVTKADLAENYQGAGNVEPGNIIAIDRNQNNFLVKATAAESQQLAGVMSTSPGQTLGQEQTNNIEMALVGRVPVKMSQSSLPIQPGDMIAVSTEPGKGIKATKPGWVVGKALEAWEPGSSKQTVLVLLNTSVYDPQLVQKSLEGYSLARQNDGTFQVTDVYGQVVDRVIALKSAMIAELRTGLAKVTELQLAGENLADVITSLDKRLALLETQPASGFTHPSSSQLVGKATLSRNSTTTFVTDNRVTTNTKIFLTPSVATDQYLAVTDIQPGVGFTVAVTNQGQAIPFSYWLIK